MITAIEIENFKAIGSPGVRVDLTPVTLLFGPNSGGKSSVVQALHYAREIFERGNLNPDRTVAGGSSVDLGGFLEFVHGRDPSRVLRMRFHLDLSMAVRSLYRSGWSDASDRSVGSDEFPPVDEVASTAAVEFAVQWGSEAQRPQVVEYAVTYDGSPLARLRASANGRTAWLDEFNFAHPMLAKQEQTEDRSEYEGSQFWEAAEVLEEQRVEDRLVGPVELRGLRSALPLGQTIRVAVQLRPKEVEPPHTDGLDQKEARRAIMRAKLQEGQEEGRIAFLESLGKAGLTTLICGPGEAVKYWLRQFRDLGPLRCVPPRNYEGTKSPDDSRWSDGAAAWDTLFTCRDELTASVSRALVDEDCLNTGYSLRRTQHVELDARFRELMTSDDALDHLGELAAELQRLPLRTRLRLIELQTGRAMQPPDVGVGLSQIVPVVVAALDGLPGLTAIEQPELHVHPAVQVGLGDLFMQNALPDPGKDDPADRRQFLIETHSEHLILRLLRRIEETTAGDLPPGMKDVHAEDVAVHYLEPTPEGVRATRLRINEDGDFIDSWPRGFFGERAEELFR